MDHTTYEAPEIRRAGAVADIVQQNQCPQITDAVIGQGQVPTCS